MVVKKIKIIHEDGTSKVIRKNGFVLYTENDDRDLQAEFIDGMEHEEALTMLKALEISIKMMVKETEKNARTKS